MSFIQGIRSWESLGMEHILQYGSVEIYSKLACLRLLFHRCLTTDQSIRCHQHVAMKVYERNSTQARRELEIYCHFNSITTEHVGSMLVRTALDNFDICTPEGPHLCLIHKPLGMSLAGVRARARAQKFPVDLLKPTLIHIFHALDFLHAEASVIHAGMILHTFPKPSSRSLTSSFRSPREEYSVGS